MSDMKDIAEMLDNKIKSERKDELKQFDTTVGELINKEVILVDDEIEEKRRKDLSKSTVLITEYERGARWGLVKALEIINNYYNDRYKELEGNK